ncbi:MAG: hypothetical protein JW751_31955 [Polyangiaceae bacterium]|nr:hypothetical protein [Polyangiaceae bacterium]
MARVQVNAGQGGQVNAEQVGRVNAGQANVRRIVAIFLPELLCELARPPRLLDGASGTLGTVREVASSHLIPPQGGVKERNGTRLERRHPFGVVLIDTPNTGSSDGVSAKDGIGGDLGPDAASSDDLLPTARLAAVSTEARRFGITEGQTIAEARAVVARLGVFRVAQSQVRAELAMVAEVALGFGITVAIEAPYELGDGESAGASSCRTTASSRNGPSVTRSLNQGNVADTVWVDITGTEHLFGGEGQLLVELASTLSELGHVVRLGVAEGPILARAIARWGVSPQREVGVRATPALVAALPVVALPIAVERAVWLMQLGVHTLGELSAIPRAAVVSRLAGEPTSRRRGPDAPKSSFWPPRYDAGLVLDLCHGRDPTLLVPYQPPRTLMEEASFEDPVSGVEPLKFVLRSLVARLAARLGGRGEAAPAFTVTLVLDASVARLVGSRPELVLDFSLAAPIWREQELFRVITTRLERLALAAPTVALRLTVSNLTERTTRQLDLSRVTANGFAGARDVDALPLLLSELTGELGSDRVGVLRSLDSHRPEAQTLLVSATGLGGTSGGGPTVRSGTSEGGPTVRFPVRLFAHSVPLTAALRNESAIFVDGRAYSLAHIEFERRLEAVEWWSQRPTSRDYYRLLLQGKDGVLEALVYVDRHTGERFLQGIFD